MKSKEKKTIIILITILILIDQIAKIFFLVTNLQTGTIEQLSFGIFNNTKSEDNVQYILIAIIAVGILIRYINRNNTYIKMNSRIVISFAIAGVISNAIDRIWKGYTINYINIPKFTQLNLGYIYIIVTWIGMAVILTKYTADRIGEKRNGPKNNSSK